MPDDNASRWRTREIITDSSEKEKRCSVDVRRTGDVERKRRASAAGGKPLRRANDYAALEILIFAIKGPIFAR